MELDGWKEAVFPIPPSSRKTNRSMHDRFENTAMERRDVFILSCHDKIIRTAFPVKKASRRGRRSEKKTPPHGGAPQEATAAGREALYNHLGIYFQPGPFFFDIGKAFYSINSRKYAITYPRRNLFTPIQYSIQMEYDPSSTPLPEAAASGAVQQAPTGPGRTPSPPAREKTSPYRTVRREDLILRDVLAADRTVLANERTLLAYARTALACFGGGAGLVHFIEAGWSQAAGWALIVVAPVITAFGVYRYLQVRRDMAPLRDARNEPIDSDKRDA